MIHDGHGRTDHRRAELVLETRAALGEGVVWDERNGLVLWVDIAPGELHRFDPASGQDVKTGIGRSISAVGLRERGGMVLASAVGFLMLDASGCEETTIPAALGPGMRMNDAKPGPDGAFWSGTMAFDKTAGLAQLLRLGPDHSVTAVRRDLTIPNGLDWTADLTRMYFVDTPTGWVDVFDYDANTHQIANPCRTPPSLRIWG